MVYHRDVSFISKENNTKLYLPFCSFSFRFGEHKIAWHSCDHSNGNGINVNEKCSIPCHQRTNNYCNGRNLRVSSKWLTDPMDHGHFCDSYTFDNNVHRNSFISFILSHHLWVSMNDQNNMFNVHFWFLLWVIFVNVCAKVKCFFFFGFIKRMTIKFIVALNFLFRFVALLCSMLLQFTI